MRLFRMRREHREWTLPRLSQALKRSLSWVKKWLKRFREADQSTLEMFKSRSRASLHRHRQIAKIVRDTILDLGDQLKEKYGRVIGAKTILYFKR